MVGRTQATEWRGKKHCWGARWVRRALTCFVPAVKNTAGVLGGGADKFIYARRVLLEFNPPSKSGPESPGHREGERKWLKNQTLLGARWGGLGVSIESGPEPQLCPS